MSAKITQISSFVLTIRQVNDNIERLRRQLCEQYQLRRGVQVPDKPGLIYCTCCGINQVNIANGHDACVECQQREGA